MGKREHGSVQHDASCCSSNEAWVVQIIPGWACTATKMFRMKQTPGLHKDKRCVYVYTYVCVQAASIESEVHWAAMLDHHLLASLDSKQQRIRWLRSCWKSCHCWLSCREGSLLICWLSLTVNHMQNQRLEESTKQAIECHLNDVKEVPWKNSAWWWGGRASKVYFK